MQNIKIHRAGRTFIRKNAYTTRKKRGFCRGGNRTGLLKSIVIRCMSRPLFLFVLIFIIVITLAISVILYSGDGTNIPKNKTIVEIAESQIGNKGGQPYWSWYGFDEPVDWCACFVSWCADKGGYIEAKKAPKFSDCQDGVNWFISNKGWYEQNTTPRPGMIIFFDWDGNGKADHVGIVKQCKDGVIYTIEGNSGDSCREESYSVGDNMIYGYGLIS